MRGAICIVSPGNLASNPRLLKEADALHGAGYAVTAVVCRYTEELRPFDEAIAAEVPWKVVSVRRDVAEGIAARAASTLFRALDSVGLPVPPALAACAYGGTFAGRDDAFFHLIRRHSVVRPNDRNYRNINFRKNVCRHTANGHRAQNSDQQSRDDKRVRTA